MNLDLYSIMPLDMDHVDEVCEDIRDQVESGVATCPLFFMKLVPEGTPPVDKAEEFAADYLVFKEKLEQWNIKSGILVQASIGHGYVLEAPSPFQKYTNVTDGKETHVCCPYDDGFCEHFKAVCAKLASTGPAVIMIDDDLRLIYRDGNGCACPLHMEEFRRRSGVDLSREEIMEALLQNPRGKYAQIFIETQKDALLKAARAMRAGIDSVDPSIPGVYCTVSNKAECAAELAEILKGEGNPAVVRIHNGNYTPAGARYFSKICYRAASQIEVLKGKVDVILAETDTCPHNRYSTGAQSVHTHLTGSLLEGVAGAKHWITKLDSFAPMSGIGYRKVLAKNAGFYQKLAELVPQLTWKGCRTPLAPETEFVFSETKRPITIDSDGWSTNVLERFGLPMYFSSQPGGAVFLAGDADALFTEEELKEMLKGPVFLAAESAESLIKRGLGEYLGVDVREWKGLNPSIEKIYVTDTYCAPQINIKELVPMDDQVRVDSMVYNTVDQKHFTPLFPGSTVYRNELGGVSVVFCGTPITAFVYFEAFSFLNEARKCQFVHLLKECGQLPVYYYGDEEVYLRAADMPDHRMLTAIFNIGLDPIEEITLDVEKEVTKVQQLLCDGTFRECGFRKEDGMIKVETPAYTLNPVILILSF